MEILLNSIALEPNRWTKDKVPRFRLEELLGPVADAGFTAVEVWQNHAALLDASALRSLRSRADTLDVTFPIVGMYPQFHLEGKEREAQLRHWDEMAKVMEALDARILKLMPGCVASADMTPEVWDRSVEFVREALERTAHTGCLVPFETHGHTVADNPDALLRFFDDVGSDRLKVCWQPIDFSNTEKAVELYDRLAPHVMHVHLQGRREMEISLLEESDLDYRWILEHILASGFDGYASLEFVRGCVVEKPEEFDLALVLSNAQRDRAFIEAMPELHVR